MNDTARLFAYTTWVLMISLGMIVFTNTFLPYVLDPDWIGLAALLGYGFLYLNFTYLAVKRYIRKVYTETRHHYLIAGLIFLPPAGWIFLVRDDVVESSPLIILIIAIACLIGAIYGRRTGRREQAAFLKRQQEKQQEND